MKFRFAIIIVIVAFILQSTLLQYIAVFGISPNLLLCLVIVFSFLYDTTYGPILSAAMGVLWDLCFGVYIGITGISFLCAALAMHPVKNYLNHEHLLPAGVAGLVGSVVNSVVFWGLYLIAGTPYSIMYMLKMQPVLLIYNLIVVLILHQIFVRNVIKHRRDQYYKGTFREARGFKL